jgi:DNA polymerase-3 subunit alpha
MSSELNDSDQLMLYIEDARANFKIEILPPDVNRSESLFSVQNGKIAFGLAAIKGVGKSATDAIIAERNENGKFKNLTDFIKRTAGVVNKRVLEAFAKTGALDSFVPDRAKLYMNADKILAYGAGARDAGANLSLFDAATDDDVATDRLAMQLSATPAWTFAQKLENEMSALGFYISAHPLDQYRGLIERAGLTTSKSLQKMGDRRSVQIAVAVNSFSKRTTKTGKQMCSVAAADSFGNIDAVAFGFTADDVAADLAGKTLVLISGKTSVRDDSVSIFIDSVTPLENWVAMVAKQLILDVSDANALPAVHALITGLRTGVTQIEININGTTIRVKDKYALSPNIVADLGALGVRAEIK